MTCPDCGGEMELRHPPSLPEGDPEEREPYWNCPECGTTRHEY